MNRLPSLAVRNVGRNRRRSLITGITIALGVTMVVLVQGLNAALTRAFTDDVVEGRVGALQVHRAGFVDNTDAVPTKLNLPYDDAFIARLEAAPHVKGVTGRIQFTGLVSNGTAQTMFIGRGLDLVREPRACPRAATVVKAGGSPLAPGDGTAVLVGDELAGSFDARVGTTLSVQTTSPSGRANALDLKVKGLTTSSFPFENKRVLTVPLPVAQELLGLDGRVTEYALAVDDIAHVDETAAALRRELGPEYEVHTWLELQPFVRDIIARFHVILGVITAVLIIIVLTGIVNTMLMSVFERVREIGTLLAIGVRRRQVAQLFLIEAATLGLLGSLVGAAAGSALVSALGERGLPVRLSGVSAVHELHPTVSPGFVVFAILLAVGGTLVASLTPSLRAARLNPVDALRS